MRARARRCCCVQCRHSSRAPRDAACSRDASAISGAASAITCRALASASASSCAAACKDTCKAGAGAGGGACALCQRRPPALPWPPPPPETLSARERLSSVSPPSLLSSDPVRMHLCSSGPNPHLCPLSRPSRPQPVRTSAAFAFSPATSAASLTEARNACAST